MCIRHISPFEGGNRGLHGYCGMEVANLGECAGLCRVGIALCLALAAFGKQGQINGLEKTLALTSHRRNNLTMPFY